LISRARQLRSALGRDFGGWVRTVHGFGSAFDGEAVEEERHARVVAYLSWNRVPAMSSTSARPGSSSASRG
jgi:hypothetical protein